MFTGRRFDRSTLPKGVFVYDIRSDGENDDFGTVEVMVRVNRTGTIITTQPIRIPKRNAYRIIRGNYHLTDNECTLDEWLKDNSDDEAEGKELCVFLFPVDEYDRYATDEEIIAGYESGESDVSKHSPDEFAAMYNDEDCGYASYWTRFIKY